MSARPDQEWWTADELAKAELKDLPNSRQGIEKQAKRLNWRADPDRARRRSGRGGGWEYHWSLFPMRAQKMLLPTDVKVEVRAGRGDAWAALDALPERVKQVAKDRLAVIQQVEVLVEGGITKFLAVSDVSRAAGKSEKTIWNWFSEIEGIAKADRLPYLAPRHRMANRKKAERPDYSAFLNNLKTLYLRLEQPTFRHSYRLAQRTHRKGPVPTEKTAKRIIDEQVPYITQVFARQGVAGLERCFPPQIRDRTAMSSLEAVNADCHKIDLFVSWPNGAVTRPQIIAFQDLYSGKILSWRVDHDPNKVMVMAAFGEMIEQWGIPKRCLFDNGREFANKWLTGGTKTRFRFKVLDSDPLGVLPLLGIQVHWARPAHGQAKPIERAFRDIAADVAKDPRFQGAYVGHKTDAKPENYGSKAIPVAEFLDVLADGIAEHNARPGRTSATAKGRSFDETFATSYATTPIQKATAEQRRLWLMSQATCKADKDNGRFKLHGNFYYADWMIDYRGKRIEARFDAEDLHAGVYAYSQAGEFLGYVPCQEKSGFFDLSEARNTEKARAAERRRQRKELKALVPTPMHEVVKELNANPVAPPQIVETKVVQAKFGPERITPRPHEFQPPVYSEEDNVRHHDFVKQHEARAKPVHEETEKERYQRYLTVLDRLNQGDELGEAEMRWLNSYPKTAEYRATTRMIKQFGKVHLEQ